MRLQLVWTLVIISQLTGYAIASSMRAGHNENANDSSELTLALPTSPIWNCVNNCSHNGVCLFNLSFYCECNKGWQGVTCGNSIPPDPFPMDSEEWLPTIWIILAIIAGVIILERCYSSIKKVVNRRRGRNDFHELYGTGSSQGEDLQFVEEDEMVNLASLERNGQIDPNTNENARLDQRERRIHDNLDLDLDIHSEQHGR